MSFIIAVWTREGIVMASDSRLTLHRTSRPNADGSPTIQSLAVGQSDSTYKTFVTENNVGISTYGDADIEGAPISGHIEMFIAQNRGLGVDEIAGGILAYFRAMTTPPQCGFLVAGYEGTAPKDRHVWDVDVGKSTTRRVDSEVEGASWRGEVDVVSRLLLPVARKNGESDYIDLPYYQIPWNFFTLQDAIDFALYAVRTTSDTIRFQPRAKTVGGPIDVLVIRPDGVLWVARKQLHA
jgi:hypothetical protein